MPQNSSALPETKIYYSKPAALQNILGSVFLFSLGFFGIYKGVDSGVIFILMAIFFLVSSLKEFTNKKEQLTLNTSGIIYKNESLIEWKEIEYTTIESIGLKNSQDYLIIKLSDDRIEILIEELNITEEELVKLIEMYSNRKGKNKLHRNRWEQ